MKTEIYETPYVEVLTTETNSVICGSGTEGYNNEEMEIYYEN